MARNYFVSTFVMVLLLAGPAVVVDAAQYDVPGIGNLAPGQAKVAVVVGAAGSGAPAGFSVQWMKYSEFLANGSQWPPAIDSRLADADFSGVPTLNTWEGTLASFSLVPWQVAVVEIGDLFDETGVTADNVSELPMETQFIFRARANGDGVVDPSPWSDNLIVGTEINVNCTLTQGFWKNHPSVWPTESLTLGNNTYTKAELLAILNEPARGNGLLIAAHQLIAAELNIAQGADLSDIMLDLIAVHSLIGSQWIPPIGTDNVHPRDASTLAQTLDDFNNGITGPGYCDPVSALESSWGDIKAAYR